MFRRYNLFPKQECRADMLMLTVRILWRDLAPSGSKKYPCKTSTIRTLEITNYMQKYRIRVYAEKCHELQGGTNK